MTETVKDLLSKMETYFGKTLPYEDKEFFAHLFEIAFIAGQNSAIAELQEKLTKIIEEKQ